MKKTFIAGLSALFLLVVSNEVHADAITVMINNTPRTYDQQPIMKNNHVYIPVRGLSEDTGSQVDYSNADKKVTITKGKKHIEFVIGSSKALVDNVQTDLPESFIINGHTMLPLRFINEILGFKVDWLGDKNAVEITTDRGTVVSAIVNNAQKYLGTPYLYGGTYEKDKKFDCSSFIQKIYGESGIVLPRTSQQQVQLGTTVDVANVKPGDLVFFDFQGDGTANHVAMYIDQNTLLQSITSRGVSYTSFSSYWRDKVISVKDIINAD